MSGRDSRGPSCVWADAAAGSMVAFAEGTVPLHAKVRPSQRHMAERPVPIHYPHEVLRVGTPAPGSIHSMCVCVCLASRAFLRNPRQHDIKQQHQKQMRKHPPPRKPNFHQELAPGPPLARRPRDPPPPLAARAGTRDWPDREETQSLGRHRRGGERSRSRDRPWVAILGWGSGGGCGLWWARAGGALFFPCGSCVVGAAMILQPW